MYSLIPKRYTELKPLHRMGCHGAQGFLISAAVNPDGFSQLLARERLSMNPLQP